MWILFPLCETQRVSDFNITEFQRPLLPLELGTCASYTQSPALTCWKITGRLAHVENSHNAECAQAASLDSGYSRTFLELSSPPGKGRVGGGFARWPHASWSRLCRRQGQRGREASAFFPEPPAFLVQCQLLQTQKEEQKSKALEMIADT